MGLREMAIAIALWAGGAAASAHAQKPAFEVASIKAAQNDGDHDSDSDRGIYHTHNLTLKFLIAAAFDVDEAQVTGGPKWVGTDGWDINAKIPAEYAKATREQSAQMIEALLEERFHLAAHLESRQVAGYKLVLAGSGLKMSLAKPSEMGSETQSHNGHLTARYVTMAQLARRLSRYRDIGKVVVDETGITADKRFDLEMHWAPQQSDGKTDTDEPAIFAALQEQLGLKLSAAKVTVQAVVIDRAERPDEN